jgi:surface antigen
VKGSVLVIQPDPKGIQSDKNLGHVAIVESVTDMGGGKYKIHISEGNWKGSYSERDVDINTSGNSASIGGVPASFIYEKKH